MGECASSSRRLLELPESSRELGGSPHWVDKGGRSPMEGKDFCNPCPSPSLYKAMGGCGVDQSSPLSEPSEVE